MIRRDSIHLKGMRYTSASVNLMDSKAEPSESESRYRTIRRFFIIALLVLFGGIAWAVLSMYGILPGDAVQIIGLTILIFTAFICLATIMYTGVLAQQIPEYGELEEAYRQAMDFYDAEDWEEALDRFKELMGPNMDHKRALYYGARCCEKLDRWEDVKVYIKRYLELQPRDREAWELLSKAHKRLLEYEESEEAARRAEELPSREN